MALLDHFHLPLRSRRHREGFHFGEASAEPQVVRQLVIVPALVGATGSSLVWILLWECAIVLRAIGRFVGIN